MERGKRLIEGGMKKEQKELIEALEKSDAAIVNLKAVTDTLFLGIDPGKGGAVAVINESLEIVYLSDYPIDDPASLLLPFLIFSAKLSTVVMERASSFGQGRKSAFTFGMNIGQWQGLLIAFHLTGRTITVPPQTWQGMYLRDDVMNVEYLVPSDEQAKRKRRQNNRRYGKVQSLKYARALFGEEGLKRQRDSDRADALWLAKYGLDYYKECNGQPKEEGPKEDGSELKASTAQHSRSKEA